jgi:UDP-glucose:(heptosyl)LPS alpha-1,3-glucosyltransferase
VKVGVLRRRWTPGGGGERFVQRFVEALGRAGHEPHLFCEAWAEAPPGVVVHRVPSLGPGAAVQALAFAHRAPRMARQAGMELVHSFERALGADLVRAGEGCHRQWLRLRDRGRPAVIGAVRRWRPLHLALLWLERRICRGATRLLVVNSHMVAGDFARHYGPLRTPVALVRSGVDIDRFHPETRAVARGSARAALGIPPEEEVVVTIGSGFDRKGVATTIRALGHVQRTTGRAPLLLVVGRGRAAPYAALATRADIGERVRFLGVVPDTAPVLAAADLFVLSSVYDPASSVTLEALAMGLPVITTATDGSSEVIEHGRSGWVLPESGDWGGLGRLITLALDRDVRGPVGERGRGAVEPWTWERHLHETLALYGGLGARRGSPSE